MIDPEFDDDHEFIQMFVGRTAMRYAPFAR